MKKDKNKRERQYTKQKSEKKAEAKGKSKDKKVAKEAVPKITAPKRPRKWPRTKQKRTEKKDGMIAKTQLEPSRRSLVGKKPTDVKLEWMTKRERPAYPRLWQAPRISPWAGHR